MKNAITLIADKREKHVTKYGYDAEHDQKHTEYDFLKAAQAYMFNDPKSWPFDKESFKIDGHIESLVNAGSMIAAALDRILPKYEKGKIYSVNCIGGHGTYKVIRVGKTRKHTGSKFIYFEGIGGQLKGDISSFCIGSDFDFCSKPL